MSKRKELNGKNLMLWVKTALGTAKVIALSKSCTLSVSAQKSDGNTKDDGNWSSGSIVGLSWSASNQSVDSADQSVSNDMVYDELLALMIAGTEIEVSVGIPSNASNNDVPAGGWLRPSTGYWKGSALITNVDRGGDKGSAASVTVSFEGNGPLTKVTSGSGV